jgi:hypothetical protein
MTVLWIEILVKIRKVRKQKSASFGLTVQDIERKNVFENCYNKFS